MKIKDSAHVHEREANSNVRTSTRDVSLEGHDELLEQSLAAAAPSFSWAVCYASR
jgi:hypothetical protein